MKRYSILICMFIMIMGYSSTTRSACVVTANVSTITFPSVTLTSSPQDSSSKVLYRYSIPINRVYFTCGYGILANWRSEFLRPEFSMSSIQNTYTTGIPGVGVRIKWPESRGQNAWIPGTYSCTGDCYEPADNMVIEFVQIGVIKAGVMKAGPIAKISLSPANDPKDITDIMTINIGEVDINVKSCSIYASENSIDLGDYSLTDVKKSGFQGDIKDFSITLDCPDTSSAKIQFDGTNPWGMSSGVLQSNGTAKYAYTRLYLKQGIRYKEMTLNKLIDFGSVSSFKGVRQVGYAAQMYFDDSQRSMITAGNVKSNVIYTLTIN